MYFPVAGPVAFALFVGAANPAATAEPRVAPPLMDTIVLWLSANYDLPSAAEAPNLVSVSDTELVAMRHGHGAIVSPGEVVAVYNDADATIYLTEAWTGRTPTELSVLVHEMVHHLQSVSDIRFACPNEREAIAYRAQDAWLGLFGENLESAFGVDSATLLVRTVCTY